MNPKSFSRMLIVEMIIFLVDLFINEYYTMPDYQSKSSSKNHVNTIQNENTQEQHTELDLFEEKANPFQSAFSKVNQPQNPFQAAFAQEQKSKTVNPFQTAIQTKLAIGQSNDKYEQEAESIANKVVNQPFSNEGKSFSPIKSNNAIQRSQAKSDIFSSTSSNPIGLSNASNFIQKYGAPSKVIQRKTSNGISVKAMRFAPREIPADGKTTSQATVHYSGRIAGGSKIKWSTVGTNYGTKVDVNGLITPGAAIKKGAERVRVKFKAEDSKNPGAHTFGYLTLWEAKYWQAKIDYPKFRALVLKKDPFTPGINGKFQLIYTPKRRRLDAIIRVNFIFKDDKKGAAKWNKLSKHRFEQKLIRVVQNRWSSRFQFENIREPQKIWKKLNPVNVRVRVTRDKKAPHFTITAHKKSIRAQVVAGTARFGAGDDTPQPAFNPATGTAELTALAKQTPTPINFGVGKANVSAGDQKKLNFMAVYLRRIRNPRFKIDIIGHHQKVKHAPKATAGQKRKDLREATRLSRLRAKEVRKILKAGGATFHRITAQGVGDKGAAASKVWDKAVIKSALPKGWKNVQTTLEHEAGHMMGIGDEYISGGTKVGDPTSHYALTLNAFGKTYADAQARRVKDSASLMNGGNDIRPHHYVTFWDGLAQLTAGAAVPKVPFTQADWKFKSGT